MECKDEYARRMHYRIRIKVEPYWNVKKFDSDTNTYTAKIKVEPYWCKDFCISAHSVEVFIKVEPYWNVKQANNVDISTPFGLK